MTHETPQNAEPTFTQFPPMPLISGDTFQDGSGNPHTVSRAVITLISEDGATQEVALEYRYGGWWVPAPTEE